MLQFTEMTNENEATEAAVDKKREREPEDEANAKVDSEQGAAADGHGVAVVETVLNGVMEEDAEKADVKRAKTEAPPAASHMDLDVKEIVDSACIDTVAAVKDGE